MNKCHIAWWSQVWFLNMVNIYFHVLLFLTWYWVQGIHILVFLGKVDCEVSQSVIHVLTLVGTCMPGYLYVWTLWKLKIDWSWSLGLWAQWVYEFERWKSVKDIEIDTQYWWDWPFGREHSRTFLSREGVRKYLLVHQMFIK